MVKSLELLYSGDSEECKDQFKNYLDRVLEGDDGGLRKFFKAVLGRFAEEHSAAFASINIVDLKDKL